MTLQIHNALIRTHHITSRKKIATLKAAAKRLNVKALLRSGGIPGVMYVEGHDRVAVQSWVDVVHGLRYKDYQLAIGVQAHQPTQSPNGSVRAPHDLAPGELKEIDTVKAMGAIMGEKGLAQWWRIGMGYVKSG